MSKTFDNGVICASEQSVIIEDAIWEEAKAEFIRRGCQFVTGKDRKILSDLIIHDGAVNPAIVGQSAHKIAEMAGIASDPAVKILIAECDSVGAEEPFSYEKLSPVLGFYRAPNFSAALDRACQLIEFGGAGHTSVLYTDEVNTPHIELFQNRMPAIKAPISLDKPAAWEAEQSRKHQPIAVSRTSSGLLAAEEKIRPSRCRLIKKAAPIRTKPLTDDSSNPPNCGDWRFG